MHITDPTTLGAFVRAGLLVLAQALACPATAGVGWRQMQVPGGALEPAPTTVALYYPTAATAKRVPMGPFTVTAAVQAAPAAQVKGLILLSHGTGGTELGHSSLAQALARGGYLVAALRHPGDNWQDTSLRDGPLKARYFHQRPLQVQQVLTALLQDPLWKDRIATDSQGPRVGALGHSAGGYTVLALAGGQPDLQRLAAHCAAHRAADPLFCGYAGPADAAAPTPPAATPTPLRDPRVRAVAALAPVGVVLTAETLAAINVPTLLADAGGDRFLVPRFHADWLAQHLPQARRLTEAQAVHFAYMDTPSMPIATPDGDIAADAPGFNRAGFLQQLGKDLQGFFDQAWQR